MQDHTDRGQDWDQCRVLDTGILRKALYLTKGRGWIVDKSNTGIDNIPVSKSSPDLFLPQEEVTDACETPSGTQGQVCDGFIILSRPTNRPCGSQNAELLNTRIDEGRSVETIASRMNRCTVFRRTDRLSSMHNPCEPCSDKDDAEGIEKERGGHDHELEGKLLSYRLPRWVSATTRHRKKVFH